MGHEPVLRHDGRLPADRAPSLPDAALPGAPPLWHRVGDAGAGLGGGAAGGRRAASPALGGPGRPRHGRADAAGAGGQLRPGGRGERGGRLRCPRPRDGVGGPAAARPASSRRQGRPVRVPHGGGRHPVRAAAGGGSGPVPRLAPSGGTVPSVPSRPGPPAHRSPPGLRRSRLTPEAAGELVGPPGGWRHAPGLRRFPRAARPRLDGAGALLRRRSGGGGPALAALPAGGAGHLVPARPALPRPGHRLLGGAHPGHGAGHGPGGGTGRGAGAGRAEDRGQGDRPERLRLRRDERRPHARHRRPGGPGAPDGGGAGDAPRSLPPVVS